MTISSFPWPAQFHHVTFWMLIPQRVCRWLAGYSVIWREWATTSMELSSKKRSSEIKHRVKMLKGYIPQILIEHLVHARHCFRCQDTAVTSGDTVSTVSFLMGLLPRDGGSSQHLPLGLELFCLKNKVNFSSCAWCPLRKKKSRKSEI